MTSSCPRLSPLEILLEPGWEPVPKNPDQELWAHTLCSYCQLGKRARG